MTGIKCSHCPTIVYGPPFLANRHGEYVCFDCLLIERRATKKNSTIVAAVLYEGEAAERDTWMEME
jgi:hypothetical protein